MTSRKTIKKPNVKGNPSDIDHRKELLRLIRQLSQKYSTWAVFEDFLALSALSVSNAVDWTHKEEREAQYMEIVSRYEKPEVDLFPEMFIHLVKALEQHSKQPTDILGQVFHELELHNKYKGQFFTPQHICDFMGMVTLSEDDADINKKGFIGVCEPCAGSGAMILGFAKAMRKNGYDFQRQMVVTATDIDLKCVYMTYLQLSLYGIPAVIIHGNSLTLQEWSRWYTPVYMLDGWVWRQACGNLDKRYPEDEALKSASDPVYAAIRDAKTLIDSVNDHPKNVSEAAKIVNDTPAFDIKLRETANGQLSFDF